MEEPACGQVPDADGALGRSGTRHQPDVQSKCLQLLGMHGLTGCETTSFPFIKYKVSTLSVLEAGYFPGLLHVLGEEDAMRWDLLEVGLSFFGALYGQKPGTPMEEDRKTKTRLRLRNLPPNSTNLLLRVQRAHLQMALWKAADRHSSPDIDISNFGWEMKDGVLSPCIDAGPTGPPVLMDCRAAEKACAAICSCKKEGLSCSIYCLCQSGDECRNLHKRSQQMDDKDENNGEPQEYEALDADSSAVLLIESERNKQRSCIAFIIVI